MVARRAHNPEVGGPSPPSATKQEVNPNGWPLIVFPPHVSSRRLPSYTATTYTPLQAPQFRDKYPSTTSITAPPRTKTPILCSKRPKMVVPKAKKAQKPEFCARKARKWGSRRQKTHKNLDFVLGMPENWGSAGKKSTKTSFLCSKRTKTGVPKAKKAQKPRFCARGDGEVASESITAETLTVNVAFLQITARISKM